MDDEMDRDLDATRPRPIGEPAGATAEAMYGDDREPAGEQRQPAEAEPVPAHVDEPTPPTAGGRTPSHVANGFDLFGDGELTTMRDRWAGLQAAFVDDPAEAARQADAMVGNVLDNLQRRHRELHDEAERRPNGGPDTEALRVQFLRYRSFVRTLLG
jgi:hypothetical protein